ncbi:glycerophosphodiester phosphodiesterase [Schaalia vaccimaxillae]|uniref:glycerophosphodiester phosphodiesterase n=1 Tax=Schaalia vaccimaxillae TaxID=183916 RepID=UPI0003B5B9B0|nr:glycerophosphodiester phosphodiesterase [Schaalia vaccimaxillae]
MMPVTQAAGPIILAHRGGGLEAVENTRAAFEHTRSLGLRHIETDVHLSADGKVVISHDETLDRCYNATGEIRRFTWRELSDLHNEAGEAMMLLDEALEAFPDMYFNIDAKSAGVEGPLMQVINQHNAADRVLLASFSEPRLRTIRAAMATGVATSLGIDAVCRLVACAKTATSPAFWRIPGPRQGAIAAQVPATYGPVTVIDQRFVAAAHTAGLAVHAWTIDEADEVVRLVELGVDGIVTNRPQMVRDLLQARGLWEPPLAPTQQRQGQRPRD